MKTILGKWSNVGIAALIVFLNFLFVIRVGLAYGPYDWVQYLGGYDGTYGPYGAYDPYGTYSFPVGVVVLARQPYPLYAIPLYPLQPGITPPPSYCIPPPFLFDPPDGRSSATRNMVLRWKSDYDLKSDEVFDVLAWTEGNNPISIGTTRDKMLPLDMVKWQLSGIFGKFFWTVRIRGLDGIFRSCQSQPFSFTLTGLPDVQPPAFVPGQPPPPPPCPSKQCR